MIVRRQMTIAPVSKFVVQPTHQKSGECCTAPSSLEKHQKLFVVSIHFPSYTPFRKPLVVDSLCKGCSIRVTVSFSQINFTSAVASLFSRKQRKKPLSFYQNQHSSHSNDTMMMAGPVSFGGSNGLFGGDVAPFVSMSSSQDEFSFSRRVSTVSSASGRDERSRCKTLLPLDFQPTPYSVICGRGRFCTKATGNRRLNVIATMFVGRYSQLTRKDDKSEIVSEILRMVKDACPDERYAFIKYHEGRWWEVETLIAREKIGATLRDALHTKYKSSTKSKLERRRAKKLQEEREASEIDYSDAQPCDIQSNPELEGF